MNKLLDDGVEIAGVAHVIQPCRRGVQVVGLRCYLRVEVIPRAVVGVEWWWDAVGERGDGVW